MVAIFVFLALLMRRPWNDEGLLKTTHEANNADLVSLTQS